MLKHHNLTSPLDVFPSDTDYQQYNPNLEKQDRHQAVIKDITGIISAATARSIQRYTNRHETISVPLAAVEALDEKRRESALSSMRPTMIHEGSAVSALKDILGVDRGATLPERVQFTLTRYNGNGSELLAHEGLNSRVAGIDVAAHGLYDAAGEQLAAPLPMRHFLVLENPDESLTLREYFYTVDERGREARSFSTLTEQQAEALLSALEIFRPKAEQTEAS